MINMISAKDILLQASSSMIDIASLKKMIIPSNSTTNMMTNTRSGIIHKTKERNKQQQQQQILIIDDLDILLEGSSDDESGTFLFDERRATLHAILESIDEIVQERSKGGGITKHYNLPFILGICCSDSFNIPPILNRIGRFEKIVTMLPPSEVQRREILRFMINQLPIANNHSIKDDGGNPMSTEKLIEVWSVALARTTAGCVASDLKRICIDALTRSKSRNSKVLSNANDILSHRMDDGEGEEGILWEEIREATRSCIPSQLAQLDVSIPRDENEHFDTSLLVDKRDTKERFQQSWQSFGGYSEMKANLFRTVFRPWCRRHFDGGDNYPMSQLEREVPPPTGILFHGPSGTGKTFAADCLARSLGLNVVKVRI
jgi:SpoVK/Ycf46/Vps4 family AAA+-type ATPase